MLVKKSKILCEATYLDRIKNRVVCPEVNE